MGEEEGYSPGSDSRISQQHHQLRILSNREIPHFFFFKRGRSATCTYPIGLAIGLVFRLEPHIFVVSFELNVSPIAPPSTFFSIAATSSTETDSDSDSDTNPDPATQKSTPRTKSRLHPRAQTHRTNFTPLTSYLQPFVANQQHTPRTNFYNHRPHPRKTPLTRKRYQDQELRQANLSTSHKLLLPVWLPNQ